MCTLVIVCDKIIRKTFTGLSIVEGVSFILGFKRSYKDSNGVKQYYREIQYSLTFVKPTTNAEN